MQVTKQNFEDALSRFTSLLPSCEFVAFDEEMTGIMLADSAPNAADTPEARYAKMKRVVHEFGLMQVGLCLFHREGRRLVASPFNFFVFPDAKAGGRFVMHASTAAFHRENNMDFNLWIREGVPYLTRERHAAEMAEANAPRAPAEGKQSLVLTREDDLRFMAAAVEAISAWLGADEPELRLPDCNAFMRRALYERVALDYPEIELESRDFADPKARAGQMNKHLVAMRLTADEKAARDERLRQARLDQAKARSGFFRLWEVLTAAKKPVVGHNCLYDLLFLYSHFEAPLPATMAEFKAKLTALLPEIWDTKYVSTKRGFSETALDKLYNECVSQMKLPVTFAAGHDAYAQGGQCHDAGYDAYMTGVIFGSLAPGKEDCNKLYMMRSLFTLCIGGEDGLNHDGACFHLTFDASYSTADLINALHPDASKGMAADGSAPPLTIQWINNTQAFALVREAQLEQEAIARASMAGMHAVPLAEWLKQQGTGKDQPPAESRTCAEAPAVVEASIPEASGTEASIPEASAPAEKKKRGAAGEASIPEASAPAEKKKRGAAGEASIPEASAPAEKKKRGAAAEASIPEASAPAEKKKRGAAAEASIPEASAPAEKKKRGAAAEASIPEASAPAEKKKRGAAAEASIPEASAPAEKKKRGAAAEAAIPEASALAEKKKRGAAGETSVPEASAPAEKKKRGAAAEASIPEASALAEKKKRGTEAEASVPEASAPAEKTRRNRRTQDIPVENAPAHVESATASRAARSSARRVVSK